jgi:hypothetical protein
MDHIRNTTTKGFLTGMIMFYLQKVLILLSNEFLCEKLKKEMVLQIQTGLCLILEVENNVCIYNMLSYFQNISLFHVGFPRVAS